MVRQAPATTPQILETTGCIGSRLTLPKLHLVISHNAPTSATLINKRSSPKHVEFHACASILKSLTNWLQSLLVVYLVKPHLTSWKHSESCLLCKLSLSKCKWVSLSWTHIPFGWIFHFRETISCNLWPRGVVHVGYVWIDLTSRGSLPHFHFVLILLSLYR